MVFLKRTVARVVACAVVAVLLVTAQSGYRAQAQNGSTAAASSTTQQHDTHCDNPYIWAHDGFKRVEEYNLLTGQPTGRVALGHSAIEDGNRKLTYVSRGGFNVYNSDNLSASSVAKTTIGGIGWYDPPVVDYNGDLVLLDVSGRKLRIYRLLTRQQLENITDHNGASLRYEELATVATGFGDVLTVASDVTMLPAGLVTLIANSSSGFPLYNNFGSAGTTTPVQFGFIPHNPDGTYGQLQQLGQLEFEGNVWQPKMYGGGRGAGVFYKFGRLFVSGDDGTLYTIDEDQLRSYLGSPDPTRAIELVKHDAQLNISRELRPYMEERIVQSLDGRPDVMLQFLVEGVQKHAGTFAGYRLSSCGFDVDAVQFAAGRPTIDGSFEQDVDSSGSPVPGSYTGRFTVSFENLTDREVNGYSVLLKPTFNESLFRVEEVSWQEATGAFTGSIQGTPAAPAAAGGGVIPGAGVAGAVAGTVTPGAASVVASGGEVDLIANSTGDVTLAANGSKSVEVTVRYRQIAEDPAVCNLYGVDTVLHDCLSNTFIIPGKLLSRYGRSVVDLPGLQGQPVPLQPAPALPPVVPPAPAPAPAPGQVDPGQPGNQAGQPGDAGNQAGQPGQGANQGNPGGAVQQGNQQGQDGNVGGQAGQNNPGDKGDQGDQDSVIPVPITPNNPAEENIKPARTSPQLAETGSTPTSAPLLALATILLATTLLLASKHRNKQKHT